jgi:hypothetical protein
VVEDDGDPDRPGRVVWRPDLSADPERGEQTAQDEGNTAQAGGYDTPSAGSSVTAHRARSYPPARAVPAPGASPTEADAPGTRGPVRLLRMDMCPQSWSEAALAVLRLIGAS